MILLLFLPLLLPLGRADILRDQLENIVDYSVNPCDDFYYHLCKKGTTYDQFPLSKLADRFQSISATFKKDHLTDDPIWVDYHRMRKNSGNHTTNYAELAKQRCGSDLKCYREDSLYFKRKLALLEEATSIILAEGYDESSEDSAQEKIDEIIPKTEETISKIVAIFNPIAKSKSIEDVLVGVYRYAQIANRIRVIEFLESNSTFGDFHDISNFTTRFKEEMVKKIESSKWLHRDGIMKAVLDAVLKKVSSIEVYHDFDHIDRNLTMLRGLEKEYIDLYNSNEERKTGMESLDICFRLLDATAAMQKKWSDEMEFYFERINDDFAANAFYSENAITIYAPWLSKKEVSSELVTEILVTHAVTAHELFHSLFTGSAASLIEMYAERGQCLMDHYAKTNEIYGEGIRYSGRYTIYEDGADAEGIRLLYEMFKKDHSNEMKTEIGVNGITLEKAFFYFASMWFCDESQHVTSIDRHSAGNIRANAVVSLMPEFSEAFGCKAGDRLYTEKAQCKIFG